jgi:hypothetical protein
MTSGGCKECINGSEGGALDTVPCFGGSEACGGGETDGGGLARDALVDSSTSVLGALVATPSLATQWSPTRALAPTPVLRYGVVAHCVV